MALRKGNQEPTFSTVGDFAYTYGDDACSLFERYGIRFYESQRKEMRYFLARNDDGSYSCLTICISKPRQNGKSFAARFYALWMAAIESKHVLYSAHHGKTVRKMFKAIKDFVEGISDFRAMLKPNGKGVYSAAGSEGIYFVDEYGNDAGLIEFQTRTNSAARGETYQVIIVDEAQELTAEQLEAIKPTQIAADDADKADSDPQMIYIGTPPNAKCPGTEFARWHDEAHGGAADGIWWLEWAVTELPRTSDRAELMELVYQTNPAMGYRIKERTMYDVMATMSMDGFARECLGWWSETEQRYTACIDAADWKECVNPYPVKEGTCAYAVKFSPDGATGSMACCYRPSDGEPFVYVVDARSMSGGLRWFEETISDNYHKSAVIVIDGQSNAQALIDRLIADGVPSKRITKPRTSDAIAAYSLLANAVKEKKVTHYDQEGLNLSATKTRKRRIGDSGGWGFASTEEADATLIESCALAYWGAMTTKRKPGRKAVVL